MLMGICANSNQYQTSIQKILKKGEPKCLGNECGLWIDATPPDIKAKSRSFGHCGLINSKFQHVDYMV
jgi:hypothetical protein